MAKKQIVISCHPSGEAVIDGQGFVGTECNDAMAVFEKTMGKTIDRANKCDIHKQGRVNVQRT